MTMPSFDPWNGYSGYQAFLVVVIYAAIYVVPSAIALSRRHQSLNAIAMINILFGWTGLGWVVALLWSFTDVKSAPVAS